MMLAGVMALGLSACGGGEGGEGCEHSCSNTGTTVTPVATTATLSLATAGFSISATLPQGFTLQSLGAIAVTWTSNTTAGVQCIKLSNGVNGPFLSDVVTPIASTTLSVSPQVMPAVAGTYTGNVTLQAYSDTSCALAISGASLVVPYSVTVL